MPFETSLERISAGNIVEVHIEGKSLHFLDAEKTPKSLLGL